MSIDWNTVPYSHKYEKNKVSIFNPNSNDKITFPQFVAEMVLFNRERFIKDFQKLPRGKGWSNSISAQVRKLVQQSYVICNYFPSVNEDPLIEIAFKNFFRNNRVFKIGQYRKVRVTKEKKCNVTQDEKDVIKGITAEYNKLLKKKNIFKDTKPEEINSIKEKVISSYSNKKPSKIEALLEMEKSLIDKE